MPWRQHGHVRVNSRSPEAAASCDRCGFLYQHRDLNWQFNWTGVRLTNLRLLVCRRCLDVPSEFLRPPILGPDPVPIINARPEPFANDGISNEETQVFFAASLNSIIVTEDGKIMTPEGTNFIRFP